MKFVELKNNLAMQNYESCYIIFGDDEQVKLMAENMFKNIFKEKMPEFNIINFETNNLQPSKLIDSCKTMPLMSDKKLIVLMDDDSKEESIAGRDGKLNKNSSLINELTDYLKNPNSNTILLIKTLENSAIFNKFKNNTTIDCNRLDSNVLQKFIVNECTKKNIEIENKAIFKLIDISNGYLGTIITSINKIINSINSKVILVDDVDKNCVKSLEYSVFELTEALSNNDATKSFKILEDMKNNTKSCSSILPIIQNHFRRLFMVATSDESLNNLSKMLGVKEYAVKKSLELSKKFTKKKLMDIIKILNDIDYGTKSGQANLDDSLNYAVLLILQK